VDLAGLFQRIAVTVGFGWLTLLAVRLLRDPYMHEKHAGRIKDRYPGERRGRKGKGA
jgi:hypothetical protein